MLPIYKQERLLPLLMFFIYALVLAYIEPQGWYNSYALSIPCF